MARESMKFELNKYTIPKEYPEIYRHNFEQVDRIEEYPQFKRLIGLLSRATRIEPLIISLELKRYLMNMIEYRPVQSDPQNIGTLELIKKRVGKIRKYFIWPRKTDLRKVDVIIDDFSEGVLDNLYGSELLNNIKSLYKYKNANFLKPYPIKIKHYVIYLPWLLYALYHNKAIIKSMRIDLKPFIIIYFLRYLFGLSMKSDLKPKIIISGNDNGFPVVMGKAAGAEIVLIQNAKKMLFSDTTFKYADHYIAMGDMAYTGVLKNTGCVFRNIYNYGSIRLYNSLNGKHDREDDIDILWVSDLENQPEEEYVFKYYYSKRYEREAIILLNEYAASSNRRIVYKCRFEGEIEELKKLDLICPKITYVGRNEKNTYRLMQSSRTVLSTISSVVYEGMGVGKHGGHVNLSGNKNLNYDVRELNIEYTPDSAISFSQFAEKILTNDRDYSRYVKQDQEYIQDVLKVIKGAMRT
jgi:hypothetical protein